MAVADIVPEELSTVSHRGSQTLTLAAAGVLTATLLLFATIALFGRTSDGEPVAVLDLAPLLQERAAGPPWVTGRSERRGQTLAAASPQAAISKPVFAGHTLVADPALVENTAAGPLPRIAADGRTPMQTYAPPADPGSRPRIAIVVGGLGIAARQTAEAIAGLPPAVTLGILSYAPQAQQVANAARSSGHEVLLQVPMEPGDYPDSDPGPGMLRSGASNESNLARLHGAMIQITGYAGIASFEGSRFLSDSGALTPVLGEIAHRGLMFFKAEPSIRWAPQLEPESKAVFVQSAATLDAIPAAAAIDRQLSDLEALARKSGRAAAAASAYPVTLARIAAWASGLSGRGFVLVPASAIVQPAK